MKLKIITILKKIKRRIIRIKYFRNYKKYKKLCKKKNIKEFILFNTPLHGNIGDHAICMSVFQILNEHYIIPFEVPTAIESYIFDDIKKNIEKDAIISIMGGGFIGSQWMNEENLVNKVLMNFCNHEIVIFPHTIFFKDDSHGIQEKKKFINNVNKVKKIYIFARENRSYDFIKKELPSIECYLIPDMVLNLKIKTSSIEKKDILLCLRSDVEGILTNQDKENIIKMIKELKLNVNITDTVINKQIKQKQRKRILKQKINEFNNAKLVITDRLHGMIFAAICNTPCIVISNYNYKVKGVYELIKNDNIVFLDNIDDIQNVINNLIQKKNNENNTIYNYDNLYIVLDKVKEKKNGKN